MRMIFHMYVLKQVYTFCSFLGLDFTQAIFKARNVVSTIVNGHMQS